MKQLFERLRPLFAVTDFEQRRTDLAFLHIPKDYAEMLIRHLRDHEGFSHLVFFTAVDYIEDGIFRLIYMLHNYATKDTLGVYVDLSRAEPVMTSIHPLWEQAALYQRELKEMFGIDFPGSPGVDEDFLLEGWDEIPPMRREFDTRAYAEKTFFPRAGREKTDPRAHMQAQLYPDEGEK
ncbi:NADH-quinone oxidoreductase subunit C [Candidatus Thiosymbion oneisti]|uniref:NADH-quinone oxidoreductase subunit C n=1 Tax=Candidatus Thiosymbion oneisti TaxID=589554 RepID=UPI000A86998B|nr:NADH-quinone oxidoreductase subunit C [Candidatus Thiosymbion oneisti]